MIEHYKTIPGYRQKYTVSNHGNVVSSRGPMKPDVNRSGYYRVRLYKKGKPKRYMIHRLVLRLFKPVKGWQDLEVNHIDGDKTNNRLDNLEWMTRSENNYHRWKIIQGRGYTTYMPETA